MSLRCNVVQYLYTDYLPVPVGAVPGGDDGGAVAAVSSVSSLLYLNINDELLLIFFITVLFHIFYFLFLLKPLFKVNTIFVMFSCTGRFSLWHDFFWYIKSET